MSDTATIKLVYSDGRERVMHYYSVTRERVQLLNLVRDYLAKINVGKHVSKCSLPGVTVGLTYAGVGDCYKICLHLVEDIADLLQVLDETLTPYLAPTKEQPT